MIHASSGFYITKISLNSLYRLMVNHVWVSIYKLQTCKLTNPDEKKMVSKFGDKFVFPVFQGYKLIPFVYRQEVTTSQVPK